MEDNEPKRGTPAYVPHKTLSNFINSLKENGTPSQIDRSVLKSMSGSDQSAILGSLKYLGLISEQGVPTTDFQQLIDSDEEHRRPLMRNVLTKAYAFLFSGSIDLKRATTKQVEDAFRDQGISGSTVVKCMAFFLAAAKEAGIGVSPHVKTPAPVRSNPPKPRTGGNTQGAVPGESHSQNLETPAAAGMKQLKIQLMDKPDVTVTLPDSFNSEDWAFLEPILKAYIMRMLKESIQNGGGAK
jgi:hypothetical protein